MPPPLETPVANTRALSMQNRDSSVLISALMKATSSGRLTAPLTFQKRPTALG